MGNVDLLNINIGRHHLIKPSNPNHAIKAMVSAHVASMNQKYTIDLDLTLCQADPEHKKYGRLNY